MGLRWPKRCVQRKMNVPCSRLGLTQLSQLGISFFMSLKRTDGKYSPHNMLLMASSSCKDPKEISSLCKNTEKVTLKCKMKLLNFLQCELMPSPGILFWTIVAVLGAKP
jgi:hypothetical protein